MEIKTPPFRKERKAVTLLKLPARTMPCLWRSPMRTLRMKRPVRRTTPLTLTQTQTRLRMRNLMKHLPGRRLRKKEMRRTGPHRKECPPRIPGKTALFQMCS